MQVESRSLTGTETQAIQIRLNQLCDHFTEWPGYRGREHELIAFAFYEGFGGTDHCGKILAAAAPYALGAELVKRHGFEWCMMKQDSTWRLAINHSRLELPIDLISLDSGSWNHEQYDEPPCPGEMTNDSLAAILKAVGRSRYAPRD